MKIALFLPNWVGDAVMATPAIRAIRNRYPDAEIVAIVRPPIGDVLAGTSLVDRMLEYKPRSREPWNHGWRFALRLRAENFDAAVLFPNSLRTAWLAWLSGAERRIGFDRDGRGMLLTDRLTPHSRTTPNPVIDEYRRLAAAFDAPASRQMELAIQSQDEQQLEDFWNTTAFKTRPAEWIALNPGGAFGAAKHWPSEHFGALTRRLTTEFNQPVVVLCGPAEREIAREIIRHADHPNVMTLAEQPLSIGLTKAAVGGASLLITTDSGPRHFAAPLGVPAVTIFGPTHIPWSETFAPNAIHVQHEVDCGPCQQRVCPLGHHRCMTELMPERVFQAAESLLRQSKERAA